MTNGSFDTDSDWIKATGWSISGGKANFNGTSNNNLQQNNVTEQNKVYKVSFEVSDYVSGTVQVIIGNNLIGEDFTFSSNGVFVFYTKADSGSTQMVRFRPTTSAQFSIDNVSVVEDLSGDFQFERNSAATRVNAQGLVENVQIISPELVSNGNFSEIGTEEVLNGNFSQEGSELVTNGDFATDSDWSFAGDGSISSKISISN